ncbi:MAG: 5'/3'-nucleotidase SurE [Clostridia bacterium]|jgi:5'-nucleotidase|nr:5'/3'-nucleotidase SurE [Clostridia bacterium]
MLILLTNDDGLTATGIQTLRQTIEPLGEVVLVAPDRERSASGHGITMHKPLRVEKQYFGESLGYAVSGTPADCVKLALEQLLDRPPHLVISGINKGANLGTDVLYSGTVSGALEAIINGIPSMAVSLDLRGNELFSTAADFILKLIPIAVKQSLPSRTFLNINVPDVESTEIKGIQVAKLGARRYVNSVVERKDPRGKSYYWLSGVLEDKAQPDTDVWAVAHNYIAITPVQYDLTDYSQLTKLKTLEERNLWS